jgi:hypothetical protein
MRDEKEASFTFVHFGQQSKVARNIIGYLACVERTWVV